MGSKPFSLADGTVNVLVKGAVDHGFNLIYNAMVSVLASNAV
jgi:hypothetical protein